MKKKSRKANAEPSGGGGGGGWKEMNAKLAANRAKARAPGLTWVNGNRDASELDETSRKILAAGSAETQTGTSIFDPVLCELVYRWFCPPGGLVLDPFAGGSVRGIVASKLGRQYLGVDLRAEQIAANEVQAKAICSKPIPKWTTGDSVHLDRLAKGTKADLIFSCPPYADLEVYSENPLDLSAMSHEDFLASYRTIITKACSLLKPDRFACFVIGDARDAAGFYYGLPWRTVEAFEAAGAKLYNEAVLVTAVGSLPIRVNKQFSSSRKLGKTHQNVLVFCKGDPVKATAAIGDVEFGVVEGVDSGSPTEFGVVL